MRLSRTGLLVLRDAEFFDLGLLGTGGLGYLTDKKYVDRVRGPVITTNAVAGYVDGKYGLAIADDPESAFWDVHRQLLGTGFYFNDRRVEIGDDCQINETAAIGKDGFEVHANKLIPHGGWVSIGDRVSIGAHTCVDRSVWNEPTSIGDDTHVDNLVHIAHNDRIGARCFIAAGTVFAGSVTVGDDCYFGIGALIRPGVHIGNNAFIGMGVCVTRDVADGERLTIGNRSNG